MVGNVSAIIFRREEKFFSLFPSLPLSPLYFSFSPSLFFFSPLHFSFSSFFLLSSLRNEIAPRCLSFILPCPVTFVSLLLLLLRIYLQIFSRLDPDSHWIPIFLILKPLLGLFAYSARAQTDTRVYKHCPGGRQGRLAVFSVLYMHIVWIVYCTLFIYMHIYIYMYWTWM